MGVGGVRVSGKQVFVNWGIFINSNHQNLAINALIYPLLIGLKQV